MAMSAILGELDTRCPADTNMDILSTITGLQSSSILSATHSDLIMSNDAEFVKLFLSYLPESVEAISESEICPEKEEEEDEDEEDEPKKCKRVTRKRKRVLRSRMEHIRYKMIVYKNHKRGNPVKILKELEKTHKRMEARCMNYIAKEDLCGFMQVYEAALEKELSDGL